MSLDKRLAVIVLIVSDLESSRIVNEMLHEKADSIIARLGVPCREYNVFAISVVLDGTPDEISTLAGRLGKIPGVRVKSIQAPANG